MLRTPAKGQPSATKPVPRLRPRPVLFKILCVVFIVWIAALLAMYLLTVYPLRHPPSPGGTGAGRPGSVAEFSNPASPVNLPAMLPSVLQTVDSRREQSIAALKEFLAIPSISAKTDNQMEMRRCAQWLADHLAFAGLDVKLMPTGAGKGQPVVVAQNKHVPGRPTVLFYGHYDVQPPEPLELWTSPPFEPTVRNNAIYARGAADDKGQVWAHVEAIMAWQAHAGLPVNLIMLVEGEEEIGSSNLPEFIRENRQALFKPTSRLSATPTNTPRHSRHHLRPARNRLHGNQDYRSIARSSQRPIRWGGAQSR